MLRIIIAATLSLYACGGQPGTASVHLALQTESGRDAQGNMFTIEDATGYVRHVEFTVGDDPEEVEFRIEGPFVVDLLTGESTPSLEGITIPAGTYDRVDVRFDGGLDASGDFDYSGRATPFSIDLDFDEDARFENQAGIVLAEDAPADVLLWLDVGRWFETLPVTECLDDGDLRLDPDGTLLMEESTGSGGDCSDIENALKEAIKGSGQLDDR